MAANRHLSRLCESTPSNVEQLRIIIDTERRSDDTRLVDLFKYRSKLRITYSYEYSRAAPVYRRDSARFCRQVYAITIRLVLLYRQTVHGHRSFQTCPIFPRINKFQWTNSRLRGNRAAAFVWYSRVESKVQFGLGSRQIAKSERHCRWHCQLLPDALSCVMYAND